MVNKNEKKESELFVITKAKELTNYIFTVTEKSPKKYRFTFVSRIQNLSLSVMENLFRANDVYVKGNPSNVSVRKNYQREAMTDLRILGYISMIAKEHGCILAKQYAYMSKLISEVLSLLVRWYNSQDKTG